MDFDYYCLDHMYNEYSPPLNTVKHKFKEGDFILIDGMKATVIVCPLRSADIVVGLNAPNNQTKLAGEFNLSFINNALKKYGFQYGMIVAKSKCVLYKQCTCGSSAVYGDNATHSDWCDRS